MIRTSIIVLIVLSLSVSLTAQSDCAHAQGEPLIIGGVLPEGSLFSTDAAEPSNGVVTMVDAANACGGGRAVELMIVPADNREEALSAVETLRGKVPLIIGGGSAAVSEALNEASAEGDFVYWEVSEPLDEPSEWAFSPRPNNHQLGAAAAQFVTTQIPELIDGRTPRVALLYEERTTAVAQGIQDSLTPEIIRRYANTLDNAYQLGISIREQQIDVVMVLTFESDAAHFWNTLRQADANIAAWVQVGSRLPDVCEAFAAFSVMATGEVNEQYRLDTTGAVYSQYLDSYQQLFNVNQPGERADLAASGVYLLLTQVLNERTNSADSIRDAILASDVLLSTGFMGEGMSIDVDLHTNRAATAIIQQRQQQGFCSVYPDAVATCLNPLQSFPTWRERALAASEGKCGFDRSNSAFLDQFAADQFAAEQFARVSYLNTEAQSSQKK